MCDHRKSGNNACFDIVDFLSILLATHRCSYTEEDLKDFHILLGNVKEEEVSVMPAAGQEMFNCFCKVCSNNTDCSPESAVPTPVLCL